ncbi:hypothetical protein, partial [Ralstonia pseudosolanacearum]|uniref:hypothetical protein n=1 Tax=Ralstonia pseudosolanacearum TaxID=1310165 RepID=UPI001FFAC56C
AQVGEQTHGANRLLFASTGPRVKWNPALPASRRRLAVALSGISIAFFDHAALPIIMKSIVGKYLLFSWALFRSDLCSSEQRRTVAVSPSTAC